MISIQIYPVMDGLEVWVAASCMTKQESHYSHGGSSLATFVNREELDKLGDLGGVLRALEMFLSETPAITERFRC